MDEKTEEKIDDAVDKLTEVFTDFLCNLAEAFSKPKEEKSIEE